jgi:serine/threonine protein phosphatase PrpC
VDELIPIGEFSARSGLSPKRLRGYAADGLLVPAAVDAASGYRYYAPGQLREAALIDALRRAGLPLAEIRGLLTDPTGERLDGWAERLESDAAARRQALGQARRLLAGPTSNHRKILTTEGKTMRLSVASRSDIGRVRELNEDAVLAGESLVGVADGLGGAPGGEVASELAVSLLQAAFTGHSADALVAAVRAANRAVWERARTEEGLGGMGTTVCAAGLVGDGDLAVVNVGDSRTYLVHDGALVQLTQDHSVAADLVRRGELDQAGLLEHPQRNILTRALGGGPEVDVDTTTHPAVPGDRLLLCTDGLFTEVPAAEITAAMTSGGDLRSTADHLVDLALAAGGRDNVSVVVAQIEA